MADESTTHAASSADPGGDREQDVYLVPAVAAAVLILDYLRRTGETESLSRICMALDIPRSSGLNIIRTLMHFGLLIQDGNTKHYLLGPTLVGLGSAAADARGFVTVARPCLEVLARDTQLTAGLVHFVQTGHIFLDKVDRHAMVRVSVELGFRYPPFTGAPGKVFMSQLPAAEVERLWSEYPPAPPLSNHYPDLQSYKAELDRVRSVGYAAVVGEYVEGVNAVAAPIHAPNGTLLVLTLIGPTGALLARNIPILGERLRATGAEITVALGGTPRG